MRFFWQWLCGYICVYIKGRQINRFLNLCSRNGIHLWRITYDLENSFRANLRLKDFYDIKPFLRKTKTKIKIISKKGFPFWCHKHPKLKWFYCACILVFFIGIYSLNFVWNIDIKGNSKISTQEILECLQENEVSIGLKREKINCPQIELLLRENFNQLGWVSVYFKHTNLCIEVKESLYDVVEHTEMEYGKMYNLVANKDAVIDSIVTRSGKPIVKKGQMVKQGDVLVLGQSEIYDDSGEVKDTLLFKADALIFGNVTYNIDIPLSEIEILSLKIAGKYNDTALLHIGLQKLKYISDKMIENGAVILDKKIRIEKDEKNICFRAILYTREQIGISVPVEEVRENEFE